jgi:hypothetical protein
LADGGGHDVDDAPDTVLLLEGDIEVVSCSSLTYLSRVKTKSFGLGDDGAPAPFPHWRRRLEIAGLVVELVVDGMHRPCLLLTAWSGVLLSGCRWR